MKQTAKQKPATPAPPDFSAVFGNIFGQQTATTPSCSCEDCDDPTCSGLWGTLCAVRQYLECASHLSRMLEIQLSGTKGRPLDNHRVSGLLVELQAQISDGLEMAESALDGE